MVKEYVVYEVYGVDDCRECLHVKNLLIKNKCNYIYFNLSNNDFTMDKLSAMITNLANIEINSLPQVIRREGRGRFYVGGFSELNSEVESYV